MIDWKNFFDQPIKNDKITNENISRIATGQGDDYTTGCLLDYAYFENYCKIIAIHLSKQHTLDANPRAEEAKETVLDLLQGTVKVLRMQFHWVI